MTRRSTMRPGARAVWRSTHPIVTSAELRHQDIAQAELVLGVRLPAAYIDLLRIQNGGYLSRSYHPGVGRHLDAIWGIGGAHFSITRNDWEVALWYMETHGLVHPRGLEAMVAFSCDGSRYFCFDYGRARGDEPAVTYVDLAAFSPARLLAASFEGFLRQLEPADVRIPPLRPLGRAHCSSG